VIFDPTKRVSWKQGDPTTASVIDLRDATQESIDRELHRRVMRRALGVPDVPLAAGSDTELPVADDEDTERMPREPSPVRSRRRGLLTLLFAGLVLFGCERHQGIVLWHAYNGTERDALTQSIGRWNAENPDHPVELVAVPYGAFADKLTSAIPGGNGPDLFIYPQDRIGDWADSHVIEPIEFYLDDARVDRFSGEAVGAMAYKGSLWGLPLTIKSLALYYRTDLLAKPPATTDELIALGPRMHAKHGYAIAYANVNLYGHAPWLFGYGGKIVDDSGKLALATPEAANAMTFARQLVVTDVAPDRAEGPKVASLFNEGQAATVMSGPWFIAEINANVPWGVAPLPTVSATGKPAAPFYGAEGVLMSARAKDKATAFAVMDWLSSDASALERARIARQVVPNPAVYLEPDVANDPVMSAFRAQLAHTVEMPKGAAMRMVWDPYKTALGNVIAGRSEPGAQLIALEHEVQSYLDGH
jgi:maltose-binding protein MalE